MVGHDDDAAGRGILLRRDSLRDLDHAVRGALCMVLILEGQITFLLPDRQIWIVSGSQSPRRYRNSELLIKISSLGDTGAERRPLFEQRLQQSLVTKLTASWTENQISLNKNNRFGMGRFWFRGCPNLIGSYNVM